MLMMPLFLLYNLHTKLSSAVVTSPTQISLFSCKFMLTVKWSQWVTKQHCGVNLIYITLQLQCIFLDVSEQCKPGSAEMKSRCSIGRRNSSTSPCWWWHMRRNSRSTKCTCSASDQLSKYSIHRICCSFIYSGRTVVKRSPELCSSTVILVWLINCVYS